MDQTRNERKQRRVGRGRLIAQALQSVPKNKSELARNIRDLPASVMSLFGKRRYINSSKEQKTGFARMPKASPAIKAAPKIPQVQAQEISEIQKRRRMLQQFKK